MTDTEITTTEQPMTIAPTIVLEAAQSAAKALQHVINKKAKKVVFNGEQYLEFEDWQTLAKFYGMNVKTKDSISIEIGDTKGAKATAIVVDVKTGMEIGSAEAYCMRDEQNWRNKPWFQLASMAQTRAGAKALRNCLAWVAVLAGYRPTPAEEMESVIGEYEKKSHTHTTLPQDVMASYKQIGFITQLLTQKGYSDVQLKTKYKVSTKNDLTKQQASEIIENLQRLPDVNTTITQTDTEVNIQQEYVNPNDVINGMEEQHV